MYACQQRQSDNSLSSRVCETRACVHSQSLLKAEAVWECDADLQNRYTAFEMLRLAEQNFKYPGDLTTKDMKTLRTTVSLAWPGVCVKY